MELEEMPGQPWWVLLGPTASGKSRLALRLGRRLPVEIVSVDSMQIYRGMDIGTAKPTVEERAQVPHHMLDVLEPEERMDVARFCRMACRRIRAIAARGRKPLLVGGSAMYFKALLWGLFEGPGACPELREELRERAAEEGSDALHAELGEVDPEAAERIHPNDVKRIVRALEVYELTGEPLSDQQREFGGRPAVDCRILGLHWPRERLHERIEQRVERMIDAGLPEEVQALRGRLGPQSGQAVGYKEFVSYFEDDIDYDEAIHKIKAGTRQLAKHQETWFQRFPAVEWLQPAGGEWDEIVAEARKTLTKNDKKVDTLASLR